MYSSKSTDNAQSTATPAARVQRKNNGLKEEKIQKKSTHPGRATAGQRSGRRGLSSIISSGTGNSIAARNAVLSSLISQGIQPKVKVGNSNDRHEKEADETARKVMRMPSLRGQEQEKEDEMEVRRQPEEEPEIQGRGEEKKEVQRQVREEEPEVQAKKEEEQLQTKAGPGEGAASEVGSSFEGSLAGSKPGGDPLPGSVRSYMEPRFGADFSNIRVHTGPEAAELSSEINARAFTHGRDIYFNERNYKPESSSGRELIAHELTHTIQQGAAAQTKSRVHRSAATTARDKIQRSWVGDAWDTVSGAVSSAAEFVGDSLSAGKDWLMEWIKERVDDIPGYKLLTVVLGQDPITKKTVTRNGMNFIEAGLDIIPNGEKYKEKLQKTGKLKEAAVWLDKQFKILEGVDLKTIAGNFKNLWDSLGLADVRHPEEVLKDLLRIFSDPINRIIRFAKNVASKFLEIIKDYLLSKAVEFVKNQQSPTFYPLLTVILGYDPILQKEVDRSGKNILNGFIKLHPDGDKQLKKMKKTGSFERAVQWVDKSIVKIQNIASGLKNAFTTLWEAITDINTLMDPTGTFKKIYNKFKKPLVELASFMWTVGKKILKFIKDALLNRLSAFARDTRGYPLITVILGKDPFTGKRVLRTMENIIKGFFSLLENGEQKFNKLKESGAISRMTSWMSGAVERLNITWEYIVGLFKTAWERFSIDALMEPLKAFRDIVSLFTPPISRLLNFVVEVIKKVIEILLQVMNFPIDLISSIMEKTAAVFGLIKGDPIGFIKNLLRGVKQGFQQFFENIGTHLLNGLTDWLFGTLEEAGIKPPPDLSLKSILGLVLQILGITRDRIFDKIAEKIGREKMERIRGFMDKLTGVWAFVKDVVNRGPVAIWEYVQEKISGLWDMVLEQIKSWIMEKIITKVTTKLLSMLDPTGVMAVVNSFIAIYNAIESFIAYFTRMLRMVNRFVEGVAAVARGNLAPAANKLENALSRGVPIAIGFLANQVGLSGLGKKISKMIEAVRTKVDTAIDWLVDKAVKAGSAIINMGKSVVGSIKSWWRSRKEVRTQDSKEHELYFEGSGTSARLMIASSPKRYTAYLNSLKGSHDLKEEDIADAKAKAAEIEREKSKNVPEEEQENHGAKINGLVDDLVQLTAELPLDSTGGTNSPPVYGPLRQGFGTLVRVGYMEAKHDEGSSPSVGNTPEYDAINLRRKGGGAYYVKGHLLNDNLGGPGSTWANLTPLTVQANADHKTQFENPVKRAVNGTIARGANPEEPKGHMKNFLVRAEYGRSLPQSYHTITNEETDDLPPGMPRDTNPFEVARVLRAEQYVPTKLVCRADVKYEGGAEESLNEKINNNINYGKLSYYSLDSNPRTDFILADHIDFDAENKDKAIEGLLQLNGIGPHYAKKIYDGLKESGTIYSYKAQVGITKKTIEKNNPRYRITGGSFNG